MPRKTWWTIGAGILALILAIYLVSSINHDPSKRPQYRHADLIITRSDGVPFLFATEVAMSEVEQTYGLMFVNSLKDNEGMIFPYTPPRQVAFWMKNTLIPLDMLFIRDDGKISQIVTESQPQDLTPIPSQGPVIAVIEIKGGLAKKDGFMVGDKVESSVIKSQ